MNNEIAFPKSQLEKLIEQYNTEQNSEKVELEILYKNKKKINEKTLKKIHSYFNNKSSTIESSYILDISLLRFFAGTIVPLRLTNPDLFST